jgi:hypothetical protein
MRLLLAILLVACGSSSGPGSDGGNNPTDMGPHDFAHPPDLIDTFVCGSVVCGAGTECCGSASGSTVSAMCETKCADGGVPVACSSPQHCGGNPCCLSLKGTTPTGTACTASATACPPMFSAGATASNQTRVCRNAADCTNGDPSTNYPDCCSITQNGVTAQVCFSKPLQGLVPGMTCP